MTTKKIVYSLLLLIILLLLIQGIQENWVGSPGDWMQVQWFNRVASGQDLYLPSTHFVEGYNPVYTPLYYYLVGGLVKVGSEPLVTGKLISYISYLLTALLIFLSGSRLGRSKAVALFGVLVFLINPIYTNVAMLPQTDCLGLMFSTLGLYLVVSGRVQYSFIPFLLAVFTKQYFISAPVAVGIWLLLRHRDQLFQWCLLLLVWGVTVFLVLNALTGGALFSNVFLYTLQAGGGWYPLQHISVALLMVCVPFIASVYYLAKYKDYGLVSIYFLVSFIVMAVTIGREGSALNYTFDLVIASSILVVLLLGKILERDKTSKFIQGLGIRVSEE
jgi:hypothetical protein